jgi:hypothetical protein
MAPTTATMKKPAGAKGAGHSTAAASSSASSSDDFNDWIWLGVVVYAVFVVCKAAYQIRMFAINEYGTVIHEFDPNFNARAAEVWNGTGQSSSIEFWHCGVSYLRPPTLTLSFLSAEVPVLERP